jgi:tRNA (uracil-5-)-methyltransferase TRM9
MDLYSTHAQEFSNSRQSPWEGWRHLLKYLNFNNQNRILDLGCGNGRFLKYLIKSEVGILEYVGIDNSSELLKMTDEFMDKAKSSKTKSSYQLLNLDFEDLTWGTKVKGEYDFIGAFGITHHLKTPQSRKKFFETINYLLKPEGYLAVTFWEFLKLERYTKKIKPVLVLNSQNDFEMTFGKDGATRFCHYYNPLEIIELTHALPLKLMEEYFNDGAENNQNHYMVYKKI